MKLKIWTIKNSNLQGAQIEYLVLLFFTVHLFLYDVISIIGDKMKIIKSKFEHDLSFNDYSLSHESCFLDIESLGLNRNRDMIYLVGLVYFDKCEGLWNLVQYFAESIQEEELMLKKLVQAISGFHTIITYNGDSFDLPYLDNRFKMYNIDFEISQFESLDLYAIVRRNKQYLNLQNYKLKTLEQFIGIYREDIYSGKDCIDFYKEYLLSKNQDLRIKILRHNYDDLFYMLDLFKVLDILRDRKTISLSIKDEDLNIIINDMKAQGDFLIIEGFIESELNLKVNHYDDNFKFLMGEKDEFLFTLEYKKGLIRPKVSCLFIYAQEFSLNIIDESEYKPPKGVILLKVEKDFIIDNIKQIMEFLFKRILI